MTDAPTSRRPDRVVEVAPERLPGWVERFTASHGTPVTTLDGGDLVLAASDGTAARLVDRWGGAPTSGELDAWLAHAARDRTLGFLLVRKAAHAVGIAAGAELVAHHVDTHYVQGRTKAGGWSQQRYARRRGNQADKAFQDAADDLARVVLPRSTELDALVVGGDRAAVEAVLADRRLAPLTDRRWHGPVLQLPDPRLAVLQDAVARARAVPVEVTDPPRSAVGERG